MAFRRRTISIRVAIGGGLSVVAPERGNGEVYELKDITSQIRH